MPMIEKQRRDKDPKRPGYAVFKRGPRIGLLIVIILTPLVLYVLGTALYDLGTYISASIFEETSDEPEEQAGTTPAEQAPEETAVEEEAEPAPVAPEDPTLYLTVPKLGIYAHTVRNDNSEEALGLGAIKLPSTGFPWERGDTNTYVACHRLGFPGTESYNQCFNLPAMQQGDEVVLEDANGAVYRYRVSETPAVTPDDVQVTEPVEGRDVVTLQTCIEDLDDLSTLGPDWEARLLVRADRVG